MILAPALALPMALVLAFILALALATPPVHAADTNQTAAQVFLDTCSVCHTVGGGELTGPDLVDAAAMDRATLRSNIVRMEDYAGPIGDERIDLLVDLLSKPDAAARIAAASAEEAAPEPQETGDPERGAALFAGRRPLANGGLPCAACHRGPDGGSDRAGGTLAKSLAGAAERLGSKGLVTAAEKAAFPVMRGAYRDHPVTHDEALDLAAFLTPAEPTPTEGAPSAAHVPLGPWAAGLAAVCLAAIGLAYRRRGLRPVGPRRRLLLDAERTRTTRTTPGRATEELR